MLFTGHLHSEFEVKRKKSKYYSLDICTLILKWNRKKSKYYSPGIGTLNLKWKEKSRNIIHWASALWVFRPLVGVKRGQTITIVAEELISNKEVISSSFFELFQEVILSCSITCNCVVVCQNNGHKIEVQKNILSKDITYPLTGLLTTWNQEMLAHLKSGTHHASAWG